MMEELREVLCSTQIVEGDANVNKKLPRVGLPTSYHCV
jgi:hypothetical protein